MSCTVPFDEGRWNFDPHALTEHNNRFYGLGTADMKGFFAFVYEAAKKVDWSKQTKPLYVLATCDEETTMLGARHFTENAPFKPDYCIIGEPTSLVPIRGHKGHVANAVRCCDIAFSTSANASYKVCKYCCSCFCAFRRAISSFACKQIGRASCRERC